MSGFDENAPRLKRKLGALAGIVVGFLAAAAGYRYNYVGLLVTGIAFLIVGLLVLAFAVSRRNQTR